MVGALKAWNAGDGIGSAYVFTRVDAEWSQQAKLTADDGAAYDFFGRSVSISGDYIAVGASAGYDDCEESGSGYIFVRDGDNWVQQAKLIADDGNAGDRFGFSISISGIIPVVFSFCNDDAC
ncbi:FG-GAP repeat protein, partial [bacterium]|nr:FG-GAP repeat protein [bacterium]